ncbi:unnamed protein product [Trichogramma brassicae]|uniref:Uncharacterized protein n=1 Tax=Trichogramma brassicae TaxID=86971 RepID=A0A6H5I7A2_9HYME|nr:unnamed protein product [Trichogramma brassicae]
MSILIDNIGNFDARFKKKLNELREMVKINDDCNIENTILPFLRKLYSVSQQKRNLPNLLETFWPEEIECILSDCIENFCGDVKDNEVKPFINFVFRTGYRDEPDLDDSGSLFTHRTTPLHRAARTYNSKLKANVRELFNIYDRNDVSYTDEMGLTHFHVACMYDCRDVVEQFLEHGQDPNCIWLLAGASPLHLATKHANKYLVELLLRRGADPNLADKNGLTPMNYRVMVEKCFPRRENKELNDALERNESNNNSEQCEFNFLCIAFKFRSCDSIQILHKSFKIGHFLIEFLGTVRRLQKISIVYYVICNFGMEH